MSHSVELIQKILALVQRDYPADQHTFIFEKAIPGTRMHPDILVLDREGTTMCAVEIGYTRPEKLTAYRSDLKIPDVRWYDKAGTLHGDVRERVVCVSVDVPAPRHRFVLYGLADYSECRSDECLRDAEVEVAVDLAAEYGIEVDDEWEHAQLIAAVANRLGVKWDEDPDTAIAITEHLQAYTMLWVVTDYSRVLFHCFCDKCGDYWEASEMDRTDIQAIAEDLRHLSANEFAHTWSARVWEGAWGGEPPYLNASCDIWSTPYQDWDFLSSAEKQNFHKTLNAIREESMSEWRLEP